MDKNYKKLLCISLLLASVYGTSAARSADLQKFPIPNANSDLIVVVGDLNSGDERKFVDLALSSSSAIVAFQSRGGSLVAGMEIGKAIHLKGFSTVVPDNTPCASACALAWLGGQVRFMGNGARVGFHAVYTDDNGQPTVSSAGNAIVGAYLNQLGLPNSAIMYITQASPDEMQWLTFSDARKFGIDVKSLEIALGDKGEPSRGETTPQQGNAASSPIDAVTKETTSFVDAGNLPGDTALTVLKDKYSDQVNYFGSVRSREEVLSDKQSFFVRWPDRNYLIQPGSLTVNCSVGSSCWATASVSWKDTNNQSVSEGNATMSLHWTVQDGKWLIDAEDGKVVRRRVSHPPVVASVQPTATTGPVYQLDAASKKVVSLSQLYNDASCPQGGPLTGKVVQRYFDNGGVKLTGFVLEESDGTRTFVNADVDLDDVNQVARSWIIRGLQTLVLEGRSAQVDVQACGAAGRVLFLSAVR